MGSNDIGVGGLRAQCSDLQLYLAVDTLIFNILSMVIYRKLKEVHSW